MLVLLVAVFVWKPVRSARPFTKGAPFVATVRPAPACLVVPRLDWAARAQAASRRTAESGAVLILLPGFGTSSAVAAPLSRYLRR